MGGDDQVPVVAPGYMPPPHRTLGDPQVVRDLAGLVAAGEPPGGLQPQPLAPLLPGGRVPEPANRMLRLTSAASGNPQFPTAMPRNAPTRCRLGFTFSGTRPAMTEPAVPAMSRIRVAGHDTTAEQGAVSSTPPAGRRPGQ
jgi:hypothetical protein